MEMSKKIIKIKDIYYETLWIWDNQKRKKKI
jgi:hypothetical protein